MTDLLEGWAYPLDAKVAGYYIADHTFVKAPNNGPAFFDCYGGHSGQGEYKVDGGTGNGEYKVANCYRGPDIDLPGVGTVKDTAYLVYGVGGVCHQVANRFLYSACPWIGKQIIVTGPKGCRGGMASALVYGIYGGAAPFTPVYATCRAVSVPAPRLNNSNPDESPETYEDAINKLHSELALRAENGNPSDTNEIIRDEFNVAIKYTLGEEYATNKIDEIHSSLLKEKDAIVGDGFKGKDLADKINDVLNENLRKVASHIGAKEYKKLFGMDPDKPLILVRPELVANTSH